MDQLSDGWREGEGDGMGWHGMGWQNNYDHICMSKNLQLYKNLRVYRHLSLLGILNHLICNRIMKSRTLVAAAPALYRAATRFPGATLTHAFIAATFNRVFTAGTRIQDLASSSEHLTERGIPVIIDFCAEGTRDHVDSERLLDENARLFAESAVVAARTYGQLISIKVSALVNLNLLEKYNRAVLLRDSIWRDFSRDGRLTAQGIFDAVYRIYAGVTTQDIANYLRIIHGFQGEDLHQFSIDETSFKMNHHPYYLYETGKNEDLVIKVLLPLDRAERQEISNLRRRLDEILDREYHNPRNLRVLADAEQSFLQRAIECLCEQMQARYNHSRPYLITTLQNYLKIAQQRVDYELEVTSRRNLHLAMKLVRGAYLVEEGRVSQQQGTENPIVDSFEATTRNYLRNFEKAVTQELKGELFAATHNEATVHALIQLKQKGHPGITVNFAQLLGLADHLTFMLKDRRENVYKLLPWAETPVMVGYMIRRAEELSQMKYPLDVQHTLLANELRIRTLSL